MGDAVNTPVEVVDFILRAVDAVLKKNFNRTLADKNGHVLMWRKLLEIIGLICVWQ